MFVFRIALILLDSASDSAIETKRSLSIHRREGAFPPSGPNTSLSTPEDFPVVNSNDEGSAVRGTFHIRGSLDRITSHESRGREDTESDRRPGVELKREVSWISLRRHASSSPDRKAASLRESLRSSPSAKAMPLPPPKASLSPGLEEARMSTNGSPSNPFKSTLSNLKRFSNLPRTPSSLSMRSSSQLHATPSSSRTPSPAYPATPRPGHQKVINPWPDAMTFRDVSVMKNPAERAVAYAQKIQELTMCDTGLSEWIRLTQSRGQCAVRNIGLR